MNNIDYTRTPFVLCAGQCRITINEDTRTNRTDFLNPDCITVPAGDPMILLEVKWDDYLPNAIRRAIQVRQARERVFKYQRCRISFVMTSFSDIFKSSFLENVTSVS